MPSKHNEPVDLNTFFSANPQFLWGPACLALLLFIWPHNLETWGIGALHYVAYSVLLQFAVHGWMCSYEEQLKDSKIQHEEPFDHKPAYAATRQTAVLLTNVCYMLMPLRPMSSSWLHFVGALVGLVLAWDAYFFACHRAFHRNMKLFKFFHKLHHSIHQPMCFSAYYVEYQSHLVTEQIVFLAAGYLVPRDVLFFYLYYSTFETFMQHAGCEVDHFRLPLLPCVKVGHVRQLLSLYSLPFGAYTTAHHDWHHEKNCKNYALAFTYLDRLAGTLYAGRQVGEQPSKPMPVVTRAATLPASPTGTTGEMRLAFEQLLTANSDMLHCKAADANIVKAGPCLVKRQISGPCFVKRQISVG